MRNLKKFLALVLAMMMALSLMVTANAENVKTDYPDFDGVLDEFQEAVDVLSGMGVFRGNNGEFLPQNNIYRAEVAAIIYRLVTGDVDDTQVSLYAPLAAHFTDVDPNAWYAGYVGYCVDAGYIKGYNGEFKPLGYVTGYETLAMVLRAVGYGKEGEFTGAAWRVNVGYRAQSLDILTNLQSTHYANTLSQYSTREVVAELLFQTAAYVPTVTWSPAGGYNQYVGVPSAQYPSYNVKNPTLGYREFGLSAFDSIIVGNQATGENGTLLGYSSSTTGTVGEAVTDEWGYVVKCYTKDDDSIELIFRFTDNDISKGLNDDWDKTEIDDGSGGNDVPIETLTRNATGTVTVGGAYVYNGSVKFSYSTGLSLFGHKAKVWYNAKNNTSTGYQTYALIDEATKTAYVYAEDAILSESAATNDGTKAKLGQAAIDAGFTVQRDSDKNGDGAAHFSDRYSQMGADARNGTANISPINTYALISNSGTSVDVVIALSAEVGVIQEKNTTAVTPYLTLGNDTIAVSTFTNDSTETDRIYLSNLTDETKDEQKQTGALVTAYQIVGTGFTLADAAGNSGISGSDWGDVMYQLDPMITKEITVATFWAPTDSTGINGVQDPVLTVTPTTGDTLSLSGITEGDKIISWALPIATGKTGQTPSAGSIGSNLVPAVSVTYRAYVDLVDRFIALRPISSYDFIYGTYAGYELDGFNAGTSKYNLVGVNWNAKELTDNTINTIGLAPVDGTSYNGLTITKLDQGNGSSSTTGNQIQAGYDTGYAYDSATGDLQSIAALDQNINVMTATTWSFDSNDAAMGFKRVNTATASLLFTNETEFIIVSGTGTATLKVETAKGITGLLAGGTSADITHTTFSVAPVKDTDNMVYYQTDTDLFGTTHTDGNEVVERVILADGNLTRWNAQTLYFNFDGTDSTGAQLPANNAAALAGRTIEQYALWNNGTLGYYFIDVAASLQAPASVGATPTAWSASTDIEEQTFYTLSKIDDVNGIPVYKAVGLLSDPVGVNYTDGYNSKQSGNAVIYDYVTVNNLSTALLGKNASGGGNELVYSIDPDVVICDVQWKTDATGAVRNVRSEITTVQELNNAVSVMNTAASAAIYDDIEVAVVYDGSVITCIYVTDATP